MRRSIVKILGIVFLIGTVLSSLAYCSDVHSGKSMAADKPAVQAGPKTSTVDNVQSSYADECNAHALYLEFAKKADEEGYHQVASMFRAVARAEEVHAQGFADLIKSSGGTPHAEVEAPVVKSTKENLEAAVASEDFDKDVKYPRFIQQATKEHNKVAEVCFTYSKVAEAEHAAIYDQALNDLDAYRGGSQNFLVCPRCGKTTVAMNNPTCPTCHTPKEQFVRVQ